MNPQLIEIATTPAVFRAVFSAFNWFCNSFVCESLGDLRPLGYAPQVGTRG
jgi:hypothetical protein